LNISKTVHPIVLNGLVVSLQMTKLAFSRHFLGGSTGFLGDFQRGFVASGVVQSKNFNKVTLPKPIIGNNFY